MSWKAVAGPALFVLASIALLVYDHLNRRMTEVVFWLTLTLIVAVFGRMIRTVRNQLDALREHELSGFDDPVTGLQNRRKLRADLDAVLATTGDRRALLMLQLDDLPAYNDRYGYAAGDELLRRSASMLAEGVVPFGGAAYRVNTNRLAALVPLGERPVAEIVLAATGPLRDATAEPATSISSGEIVIPDDATDPEVAFQLAGQRLAAHQQRQHGSARRQAHAVLIAAMSVRRPELPERLRLAAYRAISLGRRLGMGIQEIDDVALAAELQGVGLLAMPESVLDSEDVLDEAEMAMVRSHTAEGARIVGAAEGLASVAALVRSSSERFDGSGYPDGLAEEAIPLGARVIAVSVAFAAMTSNRPHRPRGSAAEALAELQRHAGTQFDPRVVDALAEELAEEAVSATTG